MLLAMALDRYELALAFVGLAALVAAWVPAYTARRPLSLPIVLVAFGACLFLVPLDFIEPDPFDHLELTERATEFAVIVALMGAGLKIDRPFDWRTWSSTWRMLAIAMPLTIVLTALLGIAVGGLPLATALLVGAVLAPTDPVLASDVQVGEPTLDEDIPPEAEDDVRFTLTSEAGLNDALAFPFVYAAIRITESGSVTERWITWLGWDLVGRIVIGLVVGFVVGRILGVVSFRPPGRLTALADTPQGFVAVAATLLAYGICEVLHGYGFLAVFVAAVALRQSEPQHEFHASMHGFIEQTENLVVAGLLVVFGGALVTGILGGMSLRTVLVAVLLVAVVRPISGRIALVKTDFTRAQRWAIAFFGIRGFGSVYYLSYALGHEDFEESDQLWPIVALAILISIAVHGVSATPAMTAVDESTPDQ
jgi:NhaP-type Na+/H+ or K+/H+ antiporter